MEQTNLGIGLDHIYDHRKNFTIIGLTGKTGSGCSDVSRLLTKGFDENSYTNPLIHLRDLHGKRYENAHRKHRICYNYAKENFQGYTEVKYKDVITLFLLQKPFNDLIDFLGSNQCFEEFKESKFQEPDFSEQIMELKHLTDHFDRLFEQVQKLDLENIKKSGDWKKLYSLFFGNDFKDFSLKLHKALGKRDIDKSFDYHKLVQIITNNLRKTGNL